MAKGLSLYTFRKSNLQSPPGEMLGRRFTSIHMLGRSKPQQAAGAVTKERTGLPVEIGETESTLSAPGCATCRERGRWQPIKPEAVRQWARDPLPAAPLNDDPARSRLAATYA